MFIILKKRPIILGKCVFLQKKIQERRKARQTLIIMAFAINIKIKHMSKAKPFVKWVFFEIFSINEIKKRIFAVCCKKAYQAFKWSTFNT